MPDERKVSRGQRLKLSASTFNAMVDAVKSHKAERYSAGPPGPLTNEIGPSLTMLIKNKIGTLPTPFRIVRIGDPLLTPEGEASNLLERVAFEGLLPTSTGAIAVLQEPAGGDDIRRAVVSGVTVCYVDMVDAAHEWANPIGGISTHLESVPCGGVARILWHGAGGNPPAVPATVELALVNLMGSAACADEPPAPAPGGCDDTGWGWTQGLLHLPDEDPPFSECLKLTVLSADGYCAGIDVGQELFLRTTDGLVWTSQEWDCDLETWVDADFECDPTSVAGPAIFTKGGDTPSLQLCGVTRKLDIVCGGGGDPKVVVYEGGGTEFCDGTVPTDVCLDNTFQVRVECLCCSIDGWQGPGWYCGVEVGGDCDTDEVGIIELIEEDRCDESIQICSCRFDTEEEAEEECGTGTFSPTCSRYLASTLYALISGGNGTITLTWDGTYYKNTGGTALPCGETLYLRYDGSATQFSCNGTSWATCSVASLDCDLDVFVLIANVNMDDTIGAGCSAGSCGVLTATIKETP